jgi:uncharacterized protein (DUF849 family)
MSSEPERSQHGLMIMCAPNGARRQMADHPEIPLTVEEIANQSCDLVAAGVSVLHLHVRDAAGRHTLDPAVYRDAIESIRRAVGADLVIQITSEAVGMYSAAQQMSIVEEVSPEAVSLALSEIFPEGTDARAAERFYVGLARRGIWAQHIVYSPAEFQRLDALRAAGMLGVEHPSCLFVLGSYINRRDGSEEELRGFLGAADPAKFHWAACCFGATEQAVMRAVVQAGGHVRLGFENNLLLPDGLAATDNAELVQAFLESLGGSPSGVLGAAAVRAAFFP